MPGNRIDLRLRCITIVNDQLGYGAGVPVFVISAEPTANGDHTSLTIVRRL